MFGIPPRTWAGWEQQGRITCGRLISIPGRPGRRKVYDVDQLRQQVEEARAMRRVAPRGYMTKDDARQMFGVALRTWDEWQQEGRVRGKRIGKYQYYSIRKLERLRDEIRRQTEPYPDPDRPECWCVPVVSEKHRGMVAIIDAASLALVQGKRWNWSPGRGEGHRGSVVLAGRGSPRPPLRQIIMGVQGPHYRVGHLNGDPLDCRRENLVVRTHREAAAARRKSASRAGRPCSSRFKGVHRKEDERKWSAHITVRRGGAARETLQLGRFRSEIDAALAYDAAARELYGKHARLNLPDPAEVERLRAQDKPFQPRYDEFPPPGMIDRDDAAAMFGVSITTWTVWEQRGRIRCGQFYPLPDDRPGRCKLYPLEEMELLREEVGALGKPYPDPHRPGCYRVPLRGYLEYREAIIDAESLPVVEGRNWNWSPNYDEVGAPGSVVLAACPGPNPALARLIADVKGPRLHVQFANGDPLDCRRANLVVRTLQEQVFGNKKFRSLRGKPCTSKYKGVSWSEERGKWVAQIRRGGLYRNLGRFDDEIDAAHAYDRAARELFGEHAWLNFPDAANGERGGAIAIAFDNDSADLRAAA